MAGEGYRGLPKGKKAIPLHGGIQEDADRFLYDEPHMAYIENGVFDKQGVISKRKMYNQEAISTVPARGAALAEAVSDDTLLVLDDRGFHAYRKEVDEWSTFDEYDQYVMDRDAASEQAFGHVNACGHSFGSRHMLAYETFDPSTGHAVYVEIRDNDGVLRYENKYTNALSPRVDRLLPAENTTAVLTYVTTGGAIKVQLFNEDGLLGSEYTPVSGSGASNSVFLDGYMFGSNTPTQAWYHGADTTYYRGHCRLGLCEDANLGQTANYAMCGANTEVAIAWKDESGQLKITKCSLGGTDITNNLSGNDSFGSRYGIFDIDFNNNGDLGVLYALRTHGSLGDVTSASAGTTAVSVQRVPTATYVAGASYTVTGTLSGMYVCGTLSVDSTFTKRDVVVTRFPDHELYQLGVRDAGQRYYITTFYRNSSTQNTLYNKRPVSRGRTSGDDFYVVLEDQQNWHPEGSNDLPRGVQRQGDSPPAKQAVTDNLLKIDMTTGSFEILATYLAGTAKALWASQSECNVHLNQLLLATDGDPDTITYFGRQQIVPENINIFVEDDRPVSTAVGPTRGAGETNELVLTRGGTVGRTVALRVTQVDESTYIPRVRRGRSVIVGTARPSVITPGGMAPMSVPNTPEIYYVGTGDSTRPSGLTYNGVSGADTPAQIYAICGYTDENGNVYRSSPGAVLYVAGIDNEGGLATADRPVAVACNFPLMEQSRNVWIELYVGMKLSEPLLVTTQVQRAGQVNTIGFNPFVETSDGFFDDILGTRAGYTSGGVFGADPVPVFRDAISTSNRMWIVPVDFDGTVLYSKLYEENVSAEFNGALAINLGHDRTITALGTIDDKVVIFERDKIHLVNGTGPTNAGTGSDFVVQQLATDVGCEDPQSVVETPDGLMFYSANNGEFVLLTRNLELVDIGKPIQDLSKGFDVKCATLVSGNSEVRFAGVGAGTTDLREAADVATGLPPAPPIPRTGRTTPSDPCFVYNYRLKRWSVLSGIDAIDSFVLGNEYGWLKDNGLTLNFESEDNKYFGSIRLLFETPWLKVGELNDFVRLTNVTLIGRYLSRFKEDPATPGTYDAGDLQVTFLYDYEENGTQHTYRWRANQDLNNPLNRDNLRVKMKPGRQKISAIKMIIEEIDTTKIEVVEPNYTLGRGFEVSGCELVYGIKSEENKLGGRSK